MHRGIDLPGLCGINRRENRCISELSLPFLLTHDFLHQASLPDRCILVIDDFMVPGRAVRPAPQGDDPPRRGRDHPLLDH